jgi:hypothetical protein
LLNNQVITGLSSTTKGELDSLSKHPLIRAHLHKSWIMGVRTLVFDPSQHSSLFSPWQYSGFALAPIIAGYCEMGLEKITSISV